jgi:hypothetical protein
MKRHGLDWCGSGQGKLAGSCKYRTENWAYIKCGKFTD